MALILKAISYKGGPTTHEISAQFDEHGGSIGRAPDNHLVLPDPEKFVSRLHASIVCEGGQYFIQDSSTGGTYLELKDMQLQQSRAPLANGEILRIGEYELRVAITDSASAGFMPLVEPVVRQLELAESSLLDDPFAAQEKPADTTDLFSSFIEQPESSVFHQSFTPPGIASAPPETAVDDLEFDDLLSSLDSLPGTDSFHLPELPPLPDDFFSEDNVSEKAQPDMAADFDLGPAETETAPEGQPGDELFSQPAALPENPIPTETPAPDVFAVPSPRAKPYIAPAQAPSPQAATVAADSELVREFLAGAGIADTEHFLPPEQWPALMRTSGELLRSMVEGLMLVLRARAELKSQFRVSVTTMRSIDNNPLKFTPNVDDAIQLILSPTNPGFLSPKQAVSEGFSDIMNHQVAMTAGIQAALAEILASFDPQRIEKAQGEGVLFQKKAKCWEYFLEKYPQLKAVAQEEFFGDAFADAYEKQMLLLGRSSKKQ